MLRRVLASSACLLLALPLLAAAEVEKYKVDPVHSEVGFTVRHFVSKVPGRFNKFQGTVEMDPKDPTTMKLEGNIETASIDTNNQRRDDHLRSPDFFDATNNPTITYVSKSVAKSGDKYTVTGDLTMRGVTKSVPLELEVLGSDAMRVGLEAKGKINRKDFGIAWNKTLDQGGTVLGDDVDVVLLVEAGKEKPEQAAKK